MKRSRTGLCVELLEDRCMPAVSGLPIPSLDVGGVVWGGQGTTADGIGLLHQGDSSQTSHPFAILQASLPAAADGTFQNAYNGAFALSVNGKLFQNNNSSSVDLSNTTITSQTQTIDGLDTSVQYFFDPNSPTVRAVFSFTNSTAADVSAVVRWANSIDSHGDGQPVVVTSSDSDNALEPTDRWFITQSGSTSGPFLDWVRYGPGTVQQTPSATTSVPGVGSTPDLYADRFDLTVPAGKTVRLMFFGQVTSSEADAASHAEVFNSTLDLKDSGLLAGLTPQQLSEIANWNLNTAAAITSAPSASFVISQPNTFTITTTGEPPALITLSGALPDGVSFVDHENGTATISGTPAVFANGTYSLTVTADNGSGTVLTQALTLTVPTVARTRFVVLGADAGGGPHVKVLNLDGSLRFSFFAYDVGFSGGVRVASGDVNGDGVSDVITAPGAGGTGEVKVFDGQTGAQLYSFVPYPAFPGGVFVASGDVNGDGKADIITGADTGGGPHVKVYSGADLSLLSSFFAFDSTFRGGVRVASGDINGDGRDDIVVGAGPGRDPTVVVFDGMTLAPLQNFLAYDSAYQNGVYVAAGDTNGDGRDDVITGSASSQRAINLFDTNKQDQPRRFVSATTFVGGEHVGAVDFNGDGRDDVLFGAGPGQRDAGVVDSPTLSLREKFTTYGSGWFGGVFIAGSRDLRRHA